MIHLILFFLISFLLISAALYFLSKAYKTISSTPSKSEKLNIKEVDHSVLSKSQSSNDRRI